MTFALPDPVNRIMNLFAGHPRVRGTHGEPELDSDGIKWGIKRTARTTNEEIKRSHWENHLEGRTPLGIVPIKENNMCNWGSIDYDEYEDDQLRFIKIIESSSLPLIPCRSKSGGLHLFLFLLDEQPAGAVQAVLRELAAKIGAAGSEIFPKQTQLVIDRGDFGNWMCMPYLGTDYGGKLRKQVGITVQGNDQSLEDFLAVAEARRLDGSGFEQLATRRTKKQRKRKEDSTAPIFTDGPPCLEHMASGGFPQGGRNNSLFMLGLYFKKRGPTSWQRDIQNANHDMMNPPLQSEEVNQIIRQLEKKDYQYTCKIEPMVSHCDSTVCRKRRHGVGNGADKPVISGVSKLLSDPPIWFMDVNGFRVELLTEQMANFAQFNLVCARKFNKIFPPMKHGDWVDLLKEPIANAQEMEAPPDMTIKERLRMEFTEFLTNRAVGQRREDLLNNLPWFNEEDQKYYFFLDPFLAWRQREGRDRRDKLEVREINTVILDLGGGLTTLRINKQTTNKIRWLPAAAITPREKLDETLKDVI